MYIYRYEYLYVCVRVYVCVSIPGEVKRPISFPTQNRPHLQVQCATRRLGSRYRLHSNECAGVALARRR